MFSRCVCVCVYEYDAFYGQTIFKHIRLESADLDFFLNCCVLWPYVFSVSVCARYTYWIETMLQRRLGSIDLHSL